MKWRIIHWICYVGSLLPMQSEQIIQDGFFTDPFRQGWKQFGEASLFSWDSGTGRLAVTWDSSQPNSYFYRPLMTLLGRADNFQLGFDLEFSEVQAGIQQGKPFAFEIAFGFLNINQATNPGFFRGTGKHSPNLVEFDYFPDTGFGATIWPAIVGTNGAFNYGGDQDYLLVELAPGVVYRVQMAFSAELGILTTALTREGIPVGPVHEARLTAGFTDFRVDAVAVSSYSDEGAGGSILAKGWIDNVEIRFPEPPVRDLRLSLEDNGCQVRFLSLPRWKYTLERSQDMRQWESEISSQTGTGSMLELVDPSPFGRLAFYRVRSEKE
jgi:hypothetical protein